MANIEKPYWKELLNWQLLAAIIAVMWHLIVGTYFGDALVVSFIISNSIAHTIYFLTRLLWNKIKIGKRSGMPRSTYWVFVVGGGTIFGTIAGSLIVTLIYGQRFGFFSERHFFRFLGFCFGVSILVTVLEFMFLRLKENIAKKVKENEELKHLQVRTHLMALQSKINPHFLFNTLNTMLSLVHKAPGKVETMILNLSDIYRKVLQVPEDKNVPIKDEFHLIKEYLEIEKIRMEERLTYELHLDRDVEEKEIPPLLVEPLVENAVIHGISPLKQGGKIDVSAQKETAETGEQSIKITVRDTGSGSGDNRRQGTGFGIYSVQERMKLLYKGKGKFSMRRGEEGGTVVVLEFPVEERKEMIIDDR